MKWYQDVEPFDHFFVWFYIVGPIYKGIYEESVSFRLEMTLLILASSRTQPGPQSDTSSYPQLWYSMDHGNPSSSHNCPSVFFTQVCPALCTHVLHHSGMGTSGRKPNHSLLGDQDVSNLQQANYLTIPVDSSRLLPLQEVQWLCQHWSSSFCPLCPACLWKRGEDHRVLKDHQVWLWAQWQWPASCPGTVTLPSQLGFYLCVGRKVSSYKIFYKTRKITFCPVPKKANPTQKLPAAASSIFAHSYFFVNRTLRLSKGI